MGALRTRAKQPGEVGSSANADPQPPQIRFPLPQVEVGSPPRQTLQAKPMAPRRTLPHTDTGHPLVSPATQPLAGHIQNASNILPEPVFESPQRYQWHPHQCLTRNTRAVTG